MRVGAEAVNSKRGMNETAISTTALDSINAEIRDELTAFIRDPRWLSRARQC